MGARVLLALTTTCIVGLKSARSLDSTALSHQEATPGAAGFSRAARPRLLQAEQAVLSRNGPPGLAARHGGAAGCSSGCQSTDHHPGRDWSCARFCVKLTVARQGIIRANRTAPLRVGSTSSQQRVRRSRPGASRFCPRSWADDGILSKRTLCERTLPGRVPSDRFPDDSVRAHRVLAWGCPRVLQRGVPRCSWFVCGCDQTFALARCSVAARAPGELAA